MKKKRSPLVEEAEILIGSISHLNVDVLLGESEEESLKVPAKCSN